MFCDSCGAQIQTGQSFCQRCGKAIVGGVQPGSSRVARHAQLLGILWIAYSAFTGLVAFFLLVFFQHLLPIIIQSAPPQPGGPPAFGIAAGVGILQRADWARIMALVVGCVSLINAPFGTALGVYTLWVLLSPNAEAEFRGQRAVTA